MTSAAFSAVKGGSATAPALIRYYFDYKSPFSYLSFDATKQLARDFPSVPIEFHPYPFNMSEAFGLPGTRSEYHQLKLKYAYLDARRWANQRSLTLLGPQKAFDSTLAMCGGLLAAAAEEKAKTSGSGGSGGGAAERKNVFWEYSDRVFEQFFRRSLDIENPSAIVSVLNQSGVTDCDTDKLMAFCAGPGKTQLAATAKQAQKDGVFGVPFYYLLHPNLPSHSKSSGGGEPFFGSDRVDVLRQTLIKLTSGSGSAAAPATGAKSKPISKL